MNAGPQDHGRTRKEPPPLFMDDHQIKNRPLLPVWFVGMMVFFCAYSYLLYIYEYHDTVSFRKDQVPYQMLGVNLSRGYGYRVGNVDGLTHYKFDDSIPASKIAQYGSFRRPARYDFYRSPGYPFFLAAVYRLCGTTPRTIYFLQVFFLAFLAAMLPVIASRAWGRPGVWTGVLAAFIFMRHYAPPPNLIMAESLTLFILVPWTLLVTSWPRRPGRRKTWTLGVLGAVMNLVKPITLFIPFLCFLYLILRTARALKTKAVRQHIVLFLVGYALIILPWSIYASRIAGRWVLINTQWDINLVRANNEDTIDAGVSSREWRKAGKQEEASYLYTRLSARGYSKFHMYLVFMWRHRWDIPRIFANKLSKALKYTNARVFIFLMFAYYGTVLLLWSGRRKGGAARDFVWRETAPVFPLIYFLSFALMFVIHSGGEFRYLTIFMWAVLLPAVYYPVFAFLTIRSLRRQQRIPNETNRSV